MIRQHHSSARVAASLLFTAIICMGPALGASPSGAASIADAGQASVMEWTDLRTESAGAPVYRKLWADKIEVARSQWKKSGSEATQLPVFTLGHTFANASPPVLVSFLFDLYDCELPGNGDGSNLYAKCVMRVASGAPGAVKVKTRDRVCMLYVPPVDKPGEGPDPSQNYTTTAIGADRVLHIRVVQFGKPVSGCDSDFKVE